MEHTSNAVAEAEAAWQRLIKPEPARPQAAPVLLLPTKNPNVLRRTRKAQKEA